LSQFEPRPPVDPDGLRVVPIAPPGRRPGFNCGNDSLDRFIATDEVDEFEEAGLGRTYLVLHEGVLIGFYTLSNASLRVEYVRGERPFSRPVEERVDAFPAVMIGRLAVAREWQGRGVGRHMIDLIVPEALLQGRRSGVRLLILEALPDSVAFYERCGFTIVKETRRERGRRNRTMFLDLRPLDDLT
jgi:GNAT superfamily N-acetyltransferase